MTSPLDKFITGQATFFGVRGRCPVCHRRLPHIAAMRLRSSLDDGSALVCLECYEHRNYGFYRDKFDRVVDTLFPKQAEHRRNQQQE